MAKLNKLDIQKLIKLYLKGYCLERLGNKFKVAVPTIRYHLLKNNIIVLTK